MSFASSSGLGESRPSIDPHLLWCELCNRPVEEFDESGMHNLWGQPDATGNHRGYIVIRAYCHGEQADITLSFTDARKHAKERLVAFARPTALEQKSPPLSLGGWDEK